MREVIVYDFKNPFIVEEVIETRKAKLFRFPHWVGANAEKLWAPIEAIGQIPLR